MSVASSDAVDPPTPCGPPCALFPLHVQEGLSQLRAEISHYQGVVVNLRRQRNRFVPISRLLPELLTYIFRIYVFDHYEGDEQFVPGTTEWWLERPVSYAPSRAAIRLSFVCVHWRILVFDDPTLSTYPLLTSTWWTDTMLGNSLEYPLIVRADLRTQLNPWYRLPSPSHEILPAVCHVLSALSRVQELFLRAELTTWNNEAEDTAVQMLKCPAPLLESFTFMNVLSSEYNAPLRKYLLPEDIFGGVAPPRLSWLMLVCCPLPSNSFLLKTGTITHLELVQDEDSAFLREWTVDELCNVLTGMPLLQMLALRYYVPPAEEWGAQRLSLQHLLLLVLQDDHMACMAFIQRTNMPFSANIRIHTVVASHEGEDKTDFRSLMQRTYTLLAPFCRNTRAAHIHSRDKTNGTGTEVRVECWSDVEVIDEVDFPRVLCDDSQVSIFVKIYHQHSVFPHVVEDAMSIFGLDSVDALSIWAEDNMALEYRLGLWPSVLAHIQDVPTISVNIQTLAVLLNLSTEPSIPPSALTLPALRELMLDAVPITHVLFEKLVRFLSAHKHICKLVLHVCAIRREHLDALCGLVEVHWDERVPAIEDEGHATAFLFGEDAIMDRDLEYLESTRWLEPDVTALSAKEPFDLAWETQPDVGTTEQLSLVQGPANIHRSSLVTAARQRTTLQNAEVDIAHYQGILQDLLTQYNDRLPISRLLPELLSYVFHLIVFMDNDFEHRCKWTSDREPYPEAREAILLSHVCRKWRVLAHDDAVLWSFPLLISEEWTRRMLVLSKTAPLTIRADLTIRDWSNDEDRDELRHLALVRSTYAAVSQGLHRVRELSIQVDFTNRRGYAGTEEVARALFSPAPLLEDFHFQGFHCSPAVLFSEGIFGGTCPPVLAHLAIAGANIVDPPFRFLVGETITKLDLVGPVAPDTDKKFARRLDEMLRSSPHLESLTVYQYLPAVDPLWPDRTNTLALPNLLHLRLEDNLEKCIPFLKHLSAPQASLFLRAYMEDASDPDRSEQQLYAVVAPFCHNNVGSKIRDASIASYPSDLTGLVVAIITSDEGTTASVNLELKGNTAMRPFVRVLEDAVSGLSLEHVEEFRLGMNDEEGRPAELWPPVLERLRAVSRLQVTKELLGELIDLHAQSTAVVFYALRELSLCMVSVTPALFTRLVRFLEAHVGGGSLRKVVLDGCAIRKEHLEEMKGIVPEVSCFGQAIERAEGERENLEGEYEEAAM